MAIAATPAATATTAIPTPTHGVVNPCPPVLTGLVQPPGLLMPAGAIMSGVTANGSVTRYGIKACAAAVYAYFRATPLGDWRVAGATKQDAHQYALVIQHGAALYDLLAIDYPDATGAYIVITAR